MLVENAQNPIGVLPISFYKDFGPSNLKKQSVQANEILLQSFLNPYQTILGTTGNDPVNRWSLVKLCGVSVLSSVC